MKRFRLSILLLFVFLICSCNLKYRNDYDVRIDFRFGNKFVSFNLNEAGEAYAVKGHSSNYTEAFKIVDSTDTKPIKFDTVKKFYSILHKIEDKPVLHSSNVTDGTRTEIYYKGRKIYDVYFGDEIYWDLFRPLMQEMPKGYSPFRHEDNVFSAW